MDEPKLQAPEWPITYDIHTEGDGGELAKRDDLLIGCVIGTVARGNGSKYPKIFADVICERPNALICRTVNDRAVIFCPLENDGGGRGGFHSKPRFGEPHGSSVRWHHNKRNTSFLLLNMQRS